MDEARDTIVSAVALFVVLVFLFLVAPFLVGCTAPTGTRDLLPVEQEMVDDTVRAWDQWASQHEGFEPVSDSCYQELMEIGVSVVSSHEEMLANTGYCGPDANSIWFNPVSEEIFDEGKACPEDAQEIWGNARSGYRDRAMLIVIADTADWCIVFPHEVLHHLAKCMGYADESHSLEIWSDLGIAPGRFERSQGPNAENWVGCGSYYLINGS